MDEDKEIEFYVVQPKENKPIKVVIKGLPGYTLPNEIISDLEDQGYTVTSCNQLILKLKDVPSTAISLPSPKAHEPIGFNLFNRWNTPTRHWSLHLVATPPHPPKSRTHQKAPSIPNMGWRNLIRLQSPIRCYLCYLTGMRFSQSSAQVVPHLNGGCIIPFTMDQLHLFDCHTVSSVTQETKLCEQRLLNAKGYNIIRRDRVSGGGGLMLLIRDVHFQSLPDIDNDSVLEYIGITVLYKDRTITIKNLYHPPISQHLDTNTMEGLFDDNTKY
ncbi:hypothetical protein TNCV_4207541 [Trichonephila clavipes]|nr:hypothetical protein TNCV_4207541 [Trichonephila clavipes]